MRDLVFDDEYSIFMEVQENNVTDFMMSTEVISRPWVRGRDNSPPQTVLGDHLVGL